MNTAGLFWLGWRTARPRALRTWLTAGGVAMAVALMGSVQHLSDGTQALLARSLSGAIPRADWTVSAGQDVPDGVLVDVLAAPGVAHAAGVVEAWATLESGQAVRVLGVDLLGDLHFLPTAAQQAEVLAEPMAFMNAVDAVLLPATWAQRDGHQVGSRILLQREGGQPRTFKVMGLFGGSTPEPLVVISIDVAQAWLHLRDRFTRVDVSVEPNAKKDQVKQGLVAALRGRAQVLEPQAQGRDEGRISRTFRTGLGMAGLVAMLVAAHLAFNTVTLSMAGRRRELGMLRALGLGRRQLELLLVAESVALGAVAGAVGNLGAWWLAREILVRTSGVIFHDLPWAQDVALPLPAFSFLPASLLGAVVAAAGAIWPVRLWSRLSPKDALEQDGAPQRSHGRHARLALGTLAPALSAWIALDWGAGDHTQVAMVLCAALVLVAVQAWAPLGTWMVRVAAQLLASRVSAGVWMKLGQGAHGSAGGRMASLVGNLASAMLMVVAVAAFLASFGRGIDGWLVQRHGADVILGWSHAAQPPTWLPTGLTRALSGRQDVRAWSTLRHRTVALDTHHARVTGIRMEGQDTGLPVSDSHGNAFSARALAWEPGTPIPVVINAGAAAALHWRLGTMAEVPGPQGSVRLRVAGAGSGFDDEDVHMWMDDAAFTHAFGEAPIQECRVHVTRAASAGSLVAALSMLDLPHGTTLEEAGAIRSTIRDQVSRFLLLAQAFVWLALLISILGLVVALQANALDRMRELLTLRMLGATVTQLTGLLVSECIWMAVAACLIGVPSGLLVGGTILKALMEAQTGWALPWVMPWRATLMAVPLCVLAALLAAWIPGRFMARDATIVRWRTL